jgi:hypothetical protein
VQKRVGRFCQLCQLRAGRVSWQRDQRECAHVIH